jgi:tetratricopeptide (TPR) repeat protein
MATDTAADQLIGLTLIEAGTTTSTIRAPRRHYWQLPMFAVGVAAAIVAWQMFPPKPESPGDGFRRDLAALAGQVEKRPADTVALEAQTLKVSAVVEQYPAEAQRANFLLGSANVILAEYGAPEMADTFWLKANEHFVKCDPQQLTDKQDQTRYTFRAAKATAAASLGLPNLLVPALLAIPQGEDVGERSRLLGETYLRLTPPENKKARDELTTYLSGTYRGSPATTAKLKLTVAELCTKLNETDKARSWLKEIGTAAPAEMQAMAKVQMARLAAGDGNWDEAAKLFSSAQAIPGLPPEQLGMIRYETAMSLVAGKKVNDATAFFQQASANGGPSGVAAMIQLAMLLAQDPAGKGNRAPSADYLEMALKNVKPGEFKNPHISQNELYVAIEEVIRVCVTEGDYETAERTVAAYAYVGEKPKVLEKRAEIYYAWATALGTKTENTTICLETWRKAAAEFASLAAMHPSPNAKLEFYRKAAKCYRQAKDDMAALHSLQAIDNVSGLTPELAAAVNLDKGDLLMASHHFAEACEAYKQAVVSGGIAGTQAQLKLARAHIDEGRRRLTGATGTQVGEARGLLELGQNLLTQLANMTFETVQQRESQQEAVYDLGKLLMGQNLIESEARFRQLLQLDPAGIYAEKAKLWLGSCLLLIARGEHAGGVAPRDADKKLTEALGLFQELSQSKLPYIQAQADIRIVNVTLMLKKYDEMPPLCNKLTERYRQRPEELIVLGMLYTSYVRTERADLAARTVARMQDSFAKIPDAAFLGGMEEFTRAYWLKWFEQVKRPAG